ncbi:uncharacterized protein LOC106655370 [Trichogramma pretiosum]|uniref:uncharacterized protein LOC106655370 n=1 Tax=Trichogramma pretiosum TaxID=7493 RepID=UPI000C71B32A|nr:uncharacterized protein LOC106655370 [Trichogramma pretiosum]
MIELPNATCTLGVAYPGGSSIIRQALSKQGVPDEAIETSMASIGVSTIKSYDAALKKWWIFVHQIKGDVYEPTTKQIMEFLQQQFDRGLSHSSLNIMRSAISLIINSDIGNDKSLKRFFSGIAKLRPSLPKYNTTWDPKVIIDFYSGKPANDSLTFKDLSYKLITLLAITTGHRLQTLSLIKVQNIKFYENKIEILIPDWIKTTRKNVCQPVLILPVYPPNDKICPATTLKHYLERTKSIRGSIDLLFLSINKPVKAVCKQSLSSWVKQTLTDCNVDTSTFSAHSTRHAANSAAKRLGVNIDSILQTAGWSNVATFAKFYDRPVINDNSEFALSILNN